MKIPFPETRPSLPLAIVPICVMEIGSMIHFTTIGPILGPVNLPGRYSARLAATLVEYCTLNQPNKNVFSWRYGYNQLSPIDFWLKF